MIDRARDRLLWRAARNIHAHLTRRSWPPLSELPVYSWEGLQDRLRRWELAGERGWRTAARLLLPGIDRLTQDLLRELQELSRTVAASSRTQVLPTLSDIYRDLSALEREFPDVELQLPQNRLSVTTEPIELAGVPLGEFRIVLNWQAIGEYRAYEVVAVDPRPAGSDSGTTHPHVHDDMLCEGEGKGPIRQALQAGRLFDFFLLVRQILETYNDGSAYVPLSQWGGAECRDCGSGVSEDEITECGRCGESICYECGRDCNGCDRLCCTDCLSPCAACGEDYFCNCCLQPCTACGESVCSDCRTDDLCDACSQPPEAPDEEDSLPTPEAEETASAAADAALQPVCLGQALVPA